MVDMKGPAIVAILLYLSTISSVLILNKYLNSVSDVFCHNQASDIFPFFMANSFGAFLEENPELVIIDPDYLVAVQFMKKCQENSSAEEIKEEWKDLQWRFNLPDYGNGRDDSMTVAFMQEMNISTLKLGNFKLIEEVSGDGNNSLGVDKPLHYFLRQDLGFLNKLLYLHIVVFHQIQEHLWVGAIPGQVQAKLASHGFYLHYGLHEQIFDPLTPERLISLKIDHHSQNVTVPNDISHFLSQLPTSRYLHCPPERTASWYAENSKFKANKAFEALELAALRDLKTVAWNLKMEVWLASGTLLGWYRQCSVIPYTSDTDTATWAKYLRKETDITLSLKNATQKLGTKLKLYQRFGEPTATMEISFYYNTEKLDLFFVYPNNTHFLVPFHRPGSYAYSFYQPYSLCSVAFLGLKVLAPCDTETVILTEYGPNWRIPIENYNYIYAPKNTGPWKKYNFSSRQHQYL